MNWYVLYTKSRYEKRVAEKLTSAGLEVFCPLLRTKRKWSDRWKWIEEPLFKSYCFVCLQDEDRDKVFSVSGVVRFLYHCGKPAIVRRSEIELLKTWLNEYSHESIMSLGFQANDQVFIRSGALMNYKGEVLSCNGSYLTLFLDSLGVQIKVDLRKNLVEKISS